MLDVTGTVQHAQNDLMLASTTPETSQDDLQLSDLFETCTDAVKLVQVQ